MLFSEINPYIRYARYLNLDKNSQFDEVVALDARLFYAIDGYGKINVADKEYEMSPHTLILINSGIPYKIATPKNSIKYFAINFDYTQNASIYSSPIEPVNINEFKEEMLVDFNIFEDATTLSEVLYIKEIPDIHKKLTSIINEHTQRFLYFESKSGHILAQCIADCMRVYQFGDRDAEKGITNCIIKYIHENFNQNITNYSIGEVFDYHPNYISFLIKRMTGMPIHQYIIYVRLTNAANLLENTDLSCEEIATACGFCDSAYFSRYFKSYFGISPSKFRII